jgi:hypothetical protein
LSDRGILFFGILILLSVLVLGVVIFNIPRQFLQEPSNLEAQRSPAETARTPRVEPRRSPDRPVLPFFSFDRSPNTFGIRPFGLYRGGWEGLGWYATAFGVLLISSVGTMFVFSRRLRLVRNVLVREPRRVPLLVLFGVVGFALLALIVSLIYLNSTTSALLLVITPAASLSILMSLVVVEAFIGGVIARMFRCTGSSMLFDLLLGVIVLFAASIIPYAGWGIVAFASVLGFGALLYTRFGAEDEWSLDPLDE